MSVSLDWDENFTMNAHVDSDGYNRIILKGYIYKQKADGIYRAPLLPDLFYGADGQQLQSTWRQYLTAGDHVILSRSGGNPTVPDHDLAWQRVSAPSPATPTRVAMADMTNPLMLLFFAGGVVLAFYGLYKVMTR